MSSLIEIRQAILQQLEPIRSERAQLKEKDAALEEAECRLERALTELEGGSLKKKKRKTKLKDDKPSVKREDVQPVCMRLVQKIVGIKQEDLKAEAADELTKQGFSRNGMPLQIDKCIKSKVFSIGADGSVSLAKTIDEETAINMFSMESNAPQLPVESLGGFRK